MIPISEQINQLLDEMHNKVNIIESYVIRRDGLIISSNTSGSNGQKISALSASIMEIGKRTLSEIGNDDLKLILVNGNKINIIIAGSNEIALVCAVKSDVNIGMVFLRMKRAAEQVQSILEAAYDKKDQAIETNSYSTIFN